MKESSKRLLETCQTLGKFDTATDTLLAGLQALARELRQKEIAAEILGTTPDEIKRQQQLAASGVDDWVQGILRADQGKL